MMQAGVVKATVVGEYTTVLAIVVERIEPKE